MPAARTFDRRAARGPVLSAAWLAAIVGLALLFAAGSQARADENLESRYPHQGFAIGGGIGPGFFLGMGAHDSLRGAGLAASLRVGTTAGPRSLLVLQIDNVAYLAEDVTEKTHTNAHSTFTLAGQYYLRDLLWMKLGLGISTLAERHKDTGDNQTLAKGFALAGSIGWDALRRHSFVLDLEVNLGTGIYRHGAITQLGIVTALNWY